MEHKKPHCLVLPYPLQGHINPMLQFSKILLDKGINVTLVTTNFRYKTLHKISSSIELETISDGYDEGRPASCSIQAYLTKFQEVGSKSLAMLIDKLNNQGLPVSCVVYDAIMQWVLGVTKSFGLFAAAFFTQSCAVHEIYYHVHKGLLRLPLVEPQILVPGLPVMEPSDMPSFLYQFGSYPVIYEMLVNQFLDFDRVDWVLCNTFYELEEEVIGWMSKISPIKAIGPTIPLRYLQDQHLQDDKDCSLHLYEPNISTCMNWLNERQDNSVVYVSFGSLAELDVAQMEEVAWGLKQSDKYFLWVVRPSEEPKLPKDFVQETVKKGLVVKWCSQLDVLAHNAVACFVSHCGWNSTLEALSSGIPMVAMPRWSDQSVNAKYVVDVWKMGVKAGQIDGTGIVTRDAVEHCIREVMDGKRGEELKRNGKKWREIAREAVKGGGSSDRCINEFVDNLVEHSATHEISVSSFTCHEKTNVVSSVDCLV